jgi:hypothetical protein
LKARKPLLWFENQHLVAVGAYSVAWPVEVCCGHFATLSRRPTRDTPSIFIQVSFASIGRLHLDIELCLPGTGCTEGNDSHSSDIERRRPNISRGTHQLL